MDQECQKSEKLVKTRNKANLCKLVKTNDCIHDYIWPNNLATCNI